MPYVIRAVVIIVILLGPADSDSINDLPPDRHFGLSRHIHCSIQRFTARDTRQICVIVLCIIIIRLRIIYIYILIMRLLLLFLLVSRVYRRTIVLLYITTNVEINHVGFFFIYTYIILSYPIVLDSHYDISLIAWTPPAKCPSIARGGIVLFSRVYRSNIII